MVVADLEKRTQKIKEMRKEIDEISVEAIEKEEEELKKLLVQGNGLNGEHTPPGNNL